MKKKKLKGVGRIIVFLAVFVGWTVCMGVVGYKWGAWGERSVSVYKADLPSERGSVLFYYRWEGGDRDDVILNCAGGGVYLRIPWEPPGFKFWLVELPTWNNCTVNRDVFWWPRMVYEPDFEIEETMP